MTATSQFEMSAKENDVSPKGIRAIEGLMAGFSRLAERLQQVAQEGGQQTFGGTFTPPGGKPLNGVFGVSVKVGLGEGNQLKVEPFGNVRSDIETGEPLVDEVREPLVDLFDEEDEVLIVAEMPGIEAEEVRAKVDGARLTLSGDGASRKYRKELEVPSGLREEEIRITGRNGIIELRARRS